MIYIYIYIRVGFNLKCAYEGFDINLKLLSLSI